MLHVEVMGEKSDVEVASDRPGAAQDHERVLARTCLLTTPVAQVYIIP